MESFHFMRGVRCFMSGALAIATELDHVSRGGANELFELFRKWLRRQFTLLGRKSEADELALHLLARSQGVAVLANATRDDDFVRREVRLLDDWLFSCAARDGAGARRISRRQS